MGLRRRAGGRSRRRPQPVDQRPQLLEQAAVDRRGDRIAARLAGVAVEKADRDGAVGVLVQPRLHAAGVPIRGGQAVRPQVQVGPGPAAGVGPGEAVDARRLALGVLGRPDAEGVRGALGSRAHPQQGELVAQIGDEGGDGDFLAGGGGDGDDEVLVGLGPLERGGRVGFRGGLGGGGAGAREAEEADFLEQAGHELAVRRQRGDGEVDVGERHAVGEGPQVVDAIPEPVPVIGQAEAGVRPPAGRRRVRPVGAPGGGQEGAAVEADLHPAGVASPAPDQADPAFRRALQGRFQRRPRRARRAVRRRDRNRLDQHEILVGLRPAHLGGVARRGKVGDRVLARQSGQELAAQGGDGEVDVGERHAVGEGPQVVDAIPEPVPVIGQAEAGVRPPAGRRRVRPVGAPGGGQEGAAVEADLHPAGVASPAPDQADPAAHERVRRGGFQAGQRRRVGGKIYKNI